MDKESTNQRYYHISDYLEQQLREINLKVEHLIFRLWYEDQRIWLKGDEKKECDQDQR